MARSVLEESDWFGFITLENVEQVKERIEGLLLLGDKYFSFVYVFRRVVDLHPSQKLIEMQLKVFEDNSAHLTLHNSRGIFWMTIGNGYKVYAEFKREGFFVVQENMETLEQVEWHVALENHN